MTVPPISDQNGIEAARLRENQFHPVDPATGRKLTAWDTRAATLQLLRHGHNDAQARLADLELKIAALEARTQVPFPASGPPTAGAS